MNKTILYIGGFELPLGNAAAKRAIANTRILEKLGYNVILLGIDKNKKYTSEIEVFKHDDITCHVTGYPHSIKEWLRYIYCIRNFRKIADRIDNLSTIICYNYQSLAYNRIRRFCQKRGIRIIGDISEWDCSYEGNLLFKIMKILDTAYRMYIVNKRVDSLIVSSRFLSNFYKSIKHIIVPTLLLRENQNYQINIKSNYIKLYYAGIPFRIGRRIRDKSKIKDRLDLSLKILYEIMKVKNNFIFNIYGITKSQYLESIPEDYELLKKMKSNVQFWGNLKTKDINDIIIQHDFLFLVREENRRSKAGFPTKVTESINHGIPVITTESSDLKDYLIEGKSAFYIDLSSYEKSINKIISILELDPDIILGMKNYCREHFVFNPEQWVDDFQKIL